MYLDSYRTIYDWPSAETKLWEEADWTDDTFQTDCHLATGRHLRLRQETHRVPPMDQKYSDICEYCISFILVG